MSCCDSRDDRILRVFPEEESETSYIDSAYTLLQNVVNQKADASGVCQVKERVVWTKIERWNPCRDCIALSKLTDAVVYKQPFFLITIALENSLQLWLLFSHGACDLVCSLGGEDIRIFQHLSCPKNGCRKKSGPLAIKVSANVGLEVASLLNLRSFDEVEKILLPKNILGILNNENYIALTVPEEIFVYKNDESFCKLFSISSCYYDALLNVNPIALGTQWIAFADARLVPRYECGGGVCVDANSQLSYTSVFISAAQSLGKGLISITGSITAALTRSPSNSPGITGALASPDLVGDAANVPLSQTPPSSTFLNNAAGNDLNGSFSTTQQNAAKHPGIVTVINCLQFAASRAKNSREAASGLVAHFCAHTGAPLAFLQFSANGSLLVTADTSGREFNVFRILAHPSSVSLAAVHHLYSLHRGDTTATVVEMSFSPDSRWLVVGTHRGTAHVFPIAPYGGSITRRTHCRKKVPNRFSRYHQSAGLDTLQAGGPISVGGGPGCVATTVAKPSQTVGSPRSNSSPLGTSPKMSQMMMMGCLGGAGGVPTSLNCHQPGMLLAGGAVGNASYPSRLNARLPPYPHPVPVRALYQIKQVLSIPGLDLVNAPTAANAPAHSAPPVVTAAATSSLPIVANNLLPIGGVASISMAFSPSSIYRPPSQLISAAASLNSLTGSGSSLPGASHHHHHRATVTNSNSAATTLCLVTWQGDVIEYKLSPRVAAHVPPEKTCQDSPIEVDADIVARWPLVSRFQAAGAVGGVPGPLYSHADVASVCPCAIVFGPAATATQSACDHRENNENCPVDVAVGVAKPAGEAVDQHQATAAWVSQVETFTCTLPSRRIWCGPQFSFQQYTPSGRSDSANSASPRPSTSSVTGGDSLGSRVVSSRTSLSTSPNVCHSEDSAFGDQERVTTPSSSASSSASGSMMTLPIQQAKTSCPVDIGPKQQKQKQRHSKSAKSSGRQRSTSNNKAECSRNTAIDTTMANSDALTVLEAYSSSLDQAELSDGNNIETELLAAAVQDLQF